MLSLVVALAVSASPSGHPPPKLASVDWTIAGVDRSLATFYQDALARSLRERGLEVVTSQDVATILGLERQKQLANCSEASSCLAELSAALGCDAAVLVSLAKLDSTLTANVKVVSSKDGRTLVETTAEADSEKTFKTRLEDAAQKIAETLVPTAPATTRSRAWIPAVAGGVLVALGAGGVGMAYGEAGKLDAELKAHGLTQSARDLAASGKTYQTGGWVLGSVGVAALAAAGAMALLGGDEAPVKPVAFVAPGGGMVGVTGVFP